MLIDKYVWHNLNLTSSFHLDCIEIVCCVDMNWSIAATINLEFLMNTCPYLVILFGELARYLVESKRGGRGRISGTPD